MGDIILDNITHKERCQVDAHYGIDQVEPVGPGLLERTGEEHHNLIDDPMKREGCHSRKETNQQCQDKDKHPVADVFHAPFV